MIDIKYIGHACVMLTSKTERLIVDPWFSSALPNEIMFAEPPHHTLSDNDLNSITAIHISHLHSDHFCESTLKTFSKQIPIIIAKHRDGVFASRVKALGFDSIVEVDAGPEGYQLGDLKLSLFVPNRTYPYDSSLVVTCNGCSYLFDNDARFSSDHYFMLGQSFRNFEAAFVGYADISPFPLIYDFSECSQLTNQNFGEHMLSYIEEQAWRCIEMICELIKPKWVSPYAASIRFKHSNLLHFNKMFFAKSSVLNRNLSRATPVGLLPGDKISANTKPSDLPKNFREPQIQVISNNSANSLCDSEVDKKSTELKAKLKSLLNQASQGWSSTLTVCFTIKTQNLEDLFFGYTFNGESVFESTLVEPEYDLSICYPAEIAGKLLFENWSFAKAHYSYQIKVKVRRLVSGQFLVHKWT